MSALCFYSPQVPKKTINECNLSMCAGGLVMLKQEKEKKKPEMLTLRKAPWYWHPRWSSALLIGRQSIRLSLFSAVCLPCWLGVRVVDTFIAVASLSETVSVFKRRSGEEGMSGVWHRGRGVLIVTRTSAQSRIKKRHPVGVYFWPCAQERTCSHFYSCVLVSFFCKREAQWCFSHRAKAAYCVRTTLRLL